MFHLLDSVPRGIMVSTTTLFASLAYLADWSNSRLLNPRWPPHAKFHDGQSLPFAMFSAATTVYLLGRRNATLEAARDSLFLAAIVGSLTKAAGLSAILYPWTDWAGPEFPNHGDFI